jgi:cellulose synthase/poly-beta-1,6-N-acetylglucosamine synthase-like glycosyltransferase
LLARTLEALEQQVTDSRFTYSIVVADNDRLQSGKPAVDACRTRSSLKVTYSVEPQQNIALARNKALATANSEYIAFIDDDEFPPKDWLATLLSACQRYDADGVLGPVRPWFDHPPPSWLIRGRFCERPEHPSGILLHWKQTRTGNVLFRSRILDGVQVPFRPELGNGGEDQDFFRSMSERGYRFVWCNEAPVYEVVPPERWTRRYMLKRALLRGQNERLFLTPASVAKSAAAAPIYALILPFLLLAGHHVFMGCAVRLCDHVGKLLAAVGLRPLGQRYLS